MQIENESSFICNSANLCVRQSDWNESIDV